MGPVSSISSTAEDREEGVQDVASTQLFRGRMARRYRNIFAVAYVLYDAQYRFLDDPKLEELAVCIDGEIKKLEDRGWIVFGAANPGQVYERYAGYSKKSPLAITR